LGLIIQSPVLIDRFSPQGILSDCHTLQHFTEMANKKEKNNEKNILFSLRDE